MFDFLKFWKKKGPDVAGFDDIAPPSLPEMPSESGPERSTGMPGESSGFAGSDFPGPGFARPAGGLAPEQAPAFRARETPLEMPQPPGAAADSSGRDFQLINAKLDSIKAGIDHIHARLDKIERKEEKEIISWR